MNTRLLTSALRRPFLSVICFVLAAASCGGDGSPPLSVRNVVPGDGDLGGRADQWRALSSGTTERLWGVSGTAQSDVIAVGTIGTAVHQLAGQWSGRETATRSDLCDVWSAPEFPAYAVGLEGTILRFDATEWAPMVSGTSAPIFDVWGFERYIAVAVGGSGTILFLDDDTWTPVTGVTDVSLFGVWGDSPADVFAVGVGGTILHYDGTAWSHMASPTTENLSAVWGASGSDVWAVGDGGGTVHYDGSAWTPVPSGVTVNLYDVWGPAGGEVWSVGAGGTILHHQNGAWGAVASGTDRDLFGVWGRSECEVYAVGDAGTILRYGPDEANEDVTVFACHDHPDGELAGPAYGLRIDDLLGEGEWTFSFDYADAAESARVTLTHDRPAGTIRIAGRAYGGEDTGSGWSGSSQGWIDIDFIYAAHVAVRGSCGESQGDDLYVRNPDALNTGTITLDGWGGDASFTFTDRGNEDACSFALDNDSDSKGNAELANDPAVYSAAGWLQPIVEGSRDWLFIATRIDAPIVCDRVAFTARSSSCSSLSPRHR
jgi:hypothetical protein